MTISSFLKIFGINIGKHITVTEINTNNAWGFGGMIGKETKYPNGYKSRIGKAYFRHLPSEKVEKYFDKKGNQITKEQFKKAVETA